MKAEQATIPGVEQFEKPEDSMTAIVKRCILDPSFDANKLSVLLDAQLKWEANEARKAYIAAMQSFKANPPDIGRTKHVQYPNKSGGETNYWHVELDKANDLIGAALRAVGIVHTWKCSDVGGRLTVTCVLTHEMGHSEDASTLSGPPDTSGGKNSIQAVGSSVTYLKRYTLLAATGLEAEGADDDGGTEGLPEDAITDYCIAMQDASNFEELRPIFVQAWEKARTVKDASAKERFRKVYEERKKDYLR